MNIAPVVVKVGGSLFDMPNLGIVLDRWLRKHCDPHVLLVPGGGPSADIVREWDRCHGLGEERSHWLALRSLTLNAHFLADILPSSRFVADWRQCDAIWHAGHRPVLDAYAFAMGDEGQPGCLPHRWDVTSDSVALRVAVVMKARQLVLLKSVTMETPYDWNCIAREGLVDRYFAEHFPQAMPIISVNLRSCYEGLPP